MKQLKKNAPVDRARRGRGAPAISEPAPGATPIDLGPAAALPSNASLVTAIVDGLQQTQGNRFVQRLVSGMRSQEAALAPATRTRMEGQLGEDLGGVRVHAGDEAAARADAADARAITEGEDIYFGAGEFAPESASGQALLAHELAHVVQQRPAAAGAAVPGASLEHEAERAEAGAATGTRTEVARHGTGPLRQRKGKEKEKAKKEEPSVSKHGVEIGPVPPAGSLSAAGRFAIAYVFATGHPMTLTLQVPAGVTTAVTPLSEVSDLKVNDAGSGARSVVIAVTPADALSRVQVAFVQGSATYLVVFHFVKAVTPAHHPPPPGHA
jgi:hypothetical protein